MNPVDDQLNRLLKSAAQAPKPAASGALFALETRVMGSWRAARREGETEFPVLWFRRAALGACVLALASLALTFQHSPGRSGDELALADSAVKIGVDP